MIQLQTEVSLRGDAEEKPKRKRGRPRKVQAVDDASAVRDDVSDAAEVAQAVASEAKKRSYEIRAEAALLVETVEDRAVELVEKAQREVAVVTGSRICLKRVSLNSHSTVHCAVTNHLIYVLIHVIDFKDALITFDYFRHYLITERLCGWQSASQRKRRNAVATSKKKTLQQKRQCSEKRQKRPEDTSDDQLCQEDHGHPEKKRTKISEEAPENSAHVGHLSRDSPAQGDDPLWWNPRDEDIVREVKTCLHVGSAETHCIPSCREKQVECITEWLDDCTSRHAGGAIYLSGVPGTGKTLAATSIVRQAVEKLNQTDCAPPVALSINCMRSKTAKDVLVRIIDAFKTAALKTVTGQLGEDPVVQVPDNDDKAVVLSGPWADLSPSGAPKKHHTFSSSY
eukprot:jgi/Picre1/31142/NNA_006496.t1